MKILLTTVSLDSQRGGGTAERTRRLATHLALAGQYCEVASIGGGDLEAVLRGHGIPVYITGSIRLRFTWPFLASTALWSRVRTADVVHILGYWNLLSVATSLLARLAGKPYLLSAAGEFVALADPRPIAFLFHKLFGESMIRHASVMVAITEFEKCQIIEKSICDKNRVIVLPNGVDVNRSPGRPVLTLAEPFVLFVGRLADIKGPDLLLEAFDRVCERHPSVKLVLAGPDFGSAPKLRARSAKPPLAGRVLFPGFLHEDDRTEAFRKALFVVVPSRAEAMSLVALEAGITGTPVLVTDQCGLDEVEEIGGGTVCAANAEAIALALDEMLSAKDLAERGERWKRHVCKKYTWTAVTAEFLRYVKNSHDPSNRHHCDPGLQW